MSNSLNETLNNENTDDLIKNIDISLNVDDDSINKQQNLNNDQKKEKEIDVSSFNQQLDLKLKNLRRKSMDDETIEMDDLNDVSLINNET
jgi:hypothetical protein